MAKIILTEKAQRNFDEIIEQIIDFTGYELSGIRLSEEFFEKFALIGYMPRAIGRDRKDGSWEAFCRGYRIVYEIINSDEIHIITIIHSRRLYPRPTDC